MNGFSYENQGSNTFLVYEVKESDNLDSMSLGMLTNNKIPGLAPTLFTQVDNTKYFKYNVSAKISADQLFEGPVNRKRLLGVFNGILDAMLSAEDYMLDINSIMMDLRYIFTDVTTCETVMICLPVMEPEHQNPDMGMFFKNIIMNTQYDQTENFDHVAKILNYLNANKILSLTDFKELLKDISKPKTEEKPAPQVTAAAPVQPVIPQLKQPLTQSAQPVVQQTVQPVVKVEPIKQEEPKKEIPAKKETSIPVNVPPVNVKKAEKEEEISLFWLLQHYNKENEAKYKAQQEAKKEAAKGAQNDKKDKKDKKEKKDKKGKKEAAPVAMPDPGFQIPGQKPSIAESFTVPAAPKQEKVTPAVSQTKQPVIQKPVIQQPTVVAAPVPGGSFDFGDTTDLRGINLNGDTTVLNQSMMKQQMQINPYLVRAKNNEKVPLNKPVFRIGKERSYVDYFIGDNTAISRSHANIINRDGEFFIVDTNSTNHTYVNGAMVQSNMEFKLEDQDRLRLADEEFEFHLR